MNPMTNIKNVQKLNERELELGIIGKKSWHDDFKDSAWVFIGGLPFDLSEGDVLCVFSQYGEIVNLNLVRDHKTGKSKGFGFLCYEDQRSTVLSVDNLNGIKILGRTIRVDHVKDYKVPKDHKDDDEMVRQMRMEGCAPQVESSPQQKDDSGTERLIEEEEDDKRTKKKKKKADKKKKKKKKEKRSSSGSESDSEDSSRHKVKVEPQDIKQEKEDKGYLKALLPSSSKTRLNGDFDGTRRNGEGPKKARRHDSSDSDGSPDASKSGSMNRDNDFSRRGGRRDDSHDIIDRGRGGDRDYDGPRRYEDSVGRDRERFNDSGRGGRDGGGDRGRDGGRDRDRERDPGRDNERDRDRHRGSGRERDIGRDRDYERDRRRDSGFARDRGRSRSRSAEKNGSKNVSRRDRDDDNYRHRDRDGRR